MKSFLHLFNTNYQNIQVTVIGLSRIKVDDLMDLSHTENKEYYDEHKEIFDIYQEHGKDADYTNTAFYKREHVNRSEGEGHSFANRRLEEALELFKSIRDTGYVRKTDKEVKVIRIEGMERKKPIKYPNRITDKYYRLSGRRRCAICKYLGIKEIITYLSRVEIVAL